MHCSPEETMSNYDKHVCLTITRAIMENHCFNMRGHQSRFHVFVLEQSRFPSSPCCQRARTSFELIQDKIIMLKDIENVPECEWNVARHLQPQDVTVGDLRMCNDLDLIFGELPKNCSTAQWIHELQFHQRPSRQTSLPMNELLITLALMGCLIHWPHIAFIIGFPWSCIVFLNNISVVWDAVSVFAAWWSLHLTNHPWHLFKAFKTPF